MTVTANYDGWGTRGTTVATEAVLAQIAATKYGYGFAAVPAGGDLCA